MIVAAALSPVSPLHTYSDDQQGNHVQLLDLTLQHLYLYI